LNHRVAHSIGRLPPLESWAARQLSAEQTFKALNFSASPAFHNYGNAQTLHTIVTEPPKRRLLIGIGALLRRSTKTCWTLISCCGSPVKICR